MVFNSTSVIVLFLSCSVVSDAQIGPVAYGSSYFSHTFHRSRSSLPSRTPIHSRHIWNIFCPRPRNIFSDGVSVARLTSSSLCSPGCMVTLSQLSQCWDCMHTPPHLAWGLILEGTPDLSTGDGMQRPTVRVPEVFMTPERPTTYTPYCPRLLSLTVPNVRNNAS